ncbi:MAG: DNA glycosylase [Thermoplasmatales archaeon]
MFSEDLTGWWKKNKREFPWRNERDPYRVMVAEKLLQRTRAENVVPVYLEFVSRFPDSSSLARAGYRAVHRVTDRIGLKSRVGSLIGTAKVIDRTYGGSVPRDIEKLRALPGIGDYISSAVMVFGFGEDYPLTDVNTVRIVSRVLGIRVTDSSRRNRRFKEAYQLLKQGSPPAEFGYAMIDLAARVCLPRVPRCRCCPVLSHCKFGKTDAKIFFPAARQL